MVSKVFCHYHVVQFFLKETLSYGQWRKTSIGFSGVRSQQYFHPSHLKINKRFLILVKSTILDKIVLVTI